ncbi:MAG: hypothetical protein U0871_08215 [Gemmataceae bacterium]
MADNPDRKLTFNLVPASSVADPQVLDDLIRLVRQGLALPVTGTPAVATDTPFRSPDQSEARSLSEVEARVKHRIEQASRDSQADVDQRAELAKQPDASDKLAEESRRAAELVVSAVQRLMLHGIRPAVPGEPESAPSLQDPA